MKKKVPDQAPADQPTPSAAFQAQTSDIKSRLATLPLANLGKTAEIIHDILTQLSWQDLNPAEAFAILELFQSTMRYLRNSLRKHYWGETNLPKDQKNKLIELSQGIEIHYATKYASILKEITALPQPAALAKIHAQAIHRALRHLTNVLVISYSLYQIPPEKLWIKLHKLYLHAEKYQLETLPLSLQSQHSAEQEELSSIEDAYKHCLLLDLANPFHLRSKEIAKLHQALLTWSSLTRIVKNDLSQCQFVIHLNKDKSAFYKEQDPGDSQQAMTRGLNTTTLRNHLQQILDPKAEHELAGKILESLSENMLQYLLKIWSQVYDREFQRVAEKGELHVCVGVSATHHFLSSGHSNTVPEEELPSDLPVLENPVESYASKLTSENLSIEIEHIESAHQPLSRSHQHYDPWAHKDKQKSAAQTEQEPHNAMSHAHFKVYTWQIRNSSPGGYCLIKETHEAVRIQVDEIVGLQPTNRELKNQWLIGMIRWIRCEQNNKTKVGIQLLAPSALAIAIQIKRDIPTEYLRAIMLPDLINLGQPSTLILPPLRFQPGEIAHIVSQNLESEVKFTKIVRANESFCQVQYTTIETIKEELEMPEDDHQNGESEDDIWEDL